MQVQQLGLCKVKNHALKQVNCLYITSVCVRAGVYVHPHMHLCVEHLCCLELFITTQFIVYQAKLKPPKHRLPTYIANV